MEMMARMVNHNNYEKITDEIMWLNNEWILKFNVILNRYNDKYGRVNYHKEVEYKKITVSSVIAFVNILILCYSVFIISNNHFVDMEISSTGISYKKAQIVMVFYFLLEAAIISIPLAIVGLIFELIAKYKNKIGKIINKLLLTLYLLVIIINIIIYEVWY